MKFKNGIIGLCIVGFFAFNSCKKEYEEFDNGEVVENTYSGTVDVTSGGADPAGDFEGDDDSGIYSFAWNNSQSQASLDFDVTTSQGGSVQIILNDAKGDEVLNKTRPENGSDSFSGVSEDGKKGTWLVTIILTNFDGDGSYSISPGN